MGCDATGVDISPAAMSLANELTLPPQRPGRGAVASRMYHGTRLPLPDASMERIVGFDAFHHLRDPRALLQGFTRVPVPGGVSTFMEPSQNHSKTAQSQAEMRNFKVIENDICLRHMMAYALAAGLAEPRMLVQFQRPLQRGAGEFTQ